MQPASATPKGLEGKNGAGFNTRHGQARRRLGRGMKILFASTELADYAKAGGLGDVSADLPRALKYCGIDVRVLMPAYQEVISKADRVSIVAQLPGRRGVEPCQIRQIH